MKYYFELYFRHILTFDFGRALESPRLESPPPGKPHPLLNADKDSILALDCMPLMDEGGPLPMTGVQHWHFADLTAEVLQNLGPTHIYLPLFASGYDAIAAVEVLEKLGYFGKITVIAPNLPRPRLVERELRTLGPGLRLTLISP